MASSSSSSYPHVAPIENVIIASDFGQPAVQGINCRVGCKESFEPQSRGTSGRYVRRRPFAAEDNESPGPCEKDGRA